MSRKSPFKRIVVGMHHGAPDDDTLRAVAELAELMHMPLLGLYAEDPGLLDLAGLPFAREFRPLGGRLASAGCRAVEPGGPARSRAIATQVRQDGKGCFD